MSYLQRAAHGGGLTPAEAEARAAYERLGAREKPHHTIQLRCCGAMVEVSDFRADIYGICPRQSCMTPYVIMGNNFNPTTKSAPKEELSNGPQFGDHTVRLEY